MKNNLFLTTIFSLTILISCTSQSSDGIFYDDNNTNRTKEIESFNNQLYLLGQHNFKENDIERTTSILCIDTSFKKIWDIHFGNNKTDERFENFTIDKQGNLYVTGHNSNSTSALLIKTNSSGQTIWKKEFKNIVSLNQIKLIDDKSIIVAGIKRFSETEIIRDSSFIQKIDSSGNAIWNTPICKDGGLRFLELSNDKIIFCLNAGAFNGQYPNSRLYCLTQNGKIEWSKDLDLTATGIDLGVKAINLKVDNTGTINVLVQSHNSYSPKMQLVQYDTIGNKLKSILCDIQSLNTNNKVQDRIYLYTGLNLSTPKSSSNGLVIKKDNFGNFYFTLIPTDGKTIYHDFIELNNSFYIISDVVDNDKHTSKWKITKSE